MAHLRANQKRIERQILTPETRDVALAGLHTQSLIEFVALLDSVSHDYPLEWDNLVSTRDSRWDQVKESTDKFAAVATDHYEYVAGLDSQKPKIKELSPLSSDAIDATTTKLAIQAESLVLDMADDVLDMYGACKEAEDNCNRAVTDFPAYPIPVLLSADERMAIFDMMSRGVGSEPNEKVDILPDRALSDSELSEIIQRNAIDIDEKGISYAISVLLNTFPNREFTYEDLARFGIILDNKGYWRNDYGHLYSCIALLAPTENYQNVNGFLSEEGLALQTGWRSEVVSDALTMTYKVARTTRICRAIPINAILDKSPKDHMRPDLTRGYIEDNWD